MSKRALLLINCPAGRGAPALSQAVESLHGLDFELVTAPVKNAEHMTARIEQHGPQLDLVIVGGGDDTLSGGSNPCQDDPDRHRQWALLWRWHGGHRRCCHR